MFCKALGSGLVVSHESEDCHSRLFARPDGLKCPVDQGYEVLEVRRGDVIYVVYLRVFDEHLQPLLISHHIPTVVLLNPRHVDIDLLVYQPAFLH